MTTKPLAVKRGRKANPDQGMLTVVPCRFNSYLVQLNRTQAAFAEEISSEADVMKIIGIKKVPRSTIALISAGRIIPSKAMLLGLCVYLHCNPGDLYESYVLALIGLEKKEDWIKDGGYWK